MSLEISGCSVNRVTPLIATLGRGCHAAEMYALKLEVRVIMHTNITGGSSIITSSRIFTNNSRHSGQCLDRMEDQSLNLDLLLIVN